MAWSTSYEGVAVIIYRYLLALAVTRDCHPQGFSIQIRAGSDDCTNSIDLVKVDLADAAAVRAEFDPVGQRRPPGVDAGAEEIMEWAQSLTIRGEVHVAPRSPHTYLGIPPMHIVLFRENIRFPRTYSPRTSQYPAPMSGLGLLGRHLLAWWPAGQ